jgi:flagellar hook-length control protein FliK
MAQAMQALQTEMTWQMGPAAGANPAMTNPANPTAPIPASHVAASALANSPVADAVDLNADASAASVSKPFLDSSNFLANPAAPERTGGRWLDTLPLAPGKSSFSETSIDSKPISEMGPLANDLQANFSALPPLPLNPAPVAALNGSVPDPAQSVVSPNPVASPLNANAAAQVTPSLNLAQTTLGNLSVLPTVPQSPNLNGLQSLKPDTSEVNSINAPLTNPLESRSTSPSMSGIRSAPLEGAKAADTGLLNAVRLQLRPVEAVTQRLATMVSQNESGSWGNLTGYTQGEGALLDLSLAAPLQGESLNGKASNPFHAGDFNDTLSALTSLGNTTTESGAAVAGLSSTQSVNSFGPPEMVKPSFTEQLATSQQNYQQMSEKLGQALASRLQDQIQSGQWKMQMNVVPAHLGKISIDLNMHSGGLDATFKSDNAATRDLIVAGMPTLRHNLNQSGTTVASVWVNADARGQSGGNPTPGQGRQTPPEAKKNPLNPEEESETSAGSTDEAGWSLMA